MQLVNVWAALFRDQIDRGECVKRRRDNNSDLYSLEVAHIKRRVFHSFFFILFLFLEIPFSVGQKY